MRATRKGTFGVIASTEGEMNFALESGDKSPHSKSAVRASEIET